jgi:hypothetical protein
MTGEILIMTHRLCLRASHSKLLRRKMILEKKKIDKFIYLNIIG